MKWFLLTMTLMMSGCSIFSPKSPGDTALDGGSSITKAAPPTVSSAPIVVPVSGTRNEPVRVHVKSVTPLDATSTLIHLLDAAGCDFAGVRITEGVVRKGSQTLDVGCK